MKNEIQDGKRITWTNGTGTAVESGDPVVVGTQIGVASVDIAAASAGALAMEGVFELPKTAGAAINQGTCPIFDITAAAFIPQAGTAAAGDISGCCIAWETAASAATTVKVKLNVAVGTVETGA